MENRFLVFGGTPHDEKGGWNDLKGTFATLDYAQAFVEKAYRSWSKYDLDGKKEPDGSVWFHVWYQIVDLNDGEIVETKLL